MIAILPWAALQCLAALVASAAIGRRGVTGASLLEAGALWLLPLGAAWLAGMTGDSLVRVASVAIVLNLALWVRQAALREQAERR